MVCTTTHSMMKLTWYVLRMSRFYCLLGPKKGARWLGWPGARIRQLKYREKSIGGTKRCSEWAGDRIEEVLVRPGLTVNQLKTSDYQVFYFSESFKSVHIYDIWCILQISLIYSIDIIIYSSLTHKWLHVYLYLLNYQLLNKFLRVLSQIARCFYSSANIFLTSATWSVTSWIENKK